MQNLSGIWLILFLNNEKLNFLTAHNPTNSLINEMNEHKQQHTLVSFALPLD